MWTAATAPSRSTLVKFAQVVVVSGGMAGGALYGFYVADCWHKKVQEQMAAAPPRVAVPNVPPHLKPALEGRQVKE